MSTVPLKRHALPLCVAVLASDPSRRARLSALVRDFGHEIASSAEEASAILTDAVPVDGSIPVVAMGMEGGHYPARLPSDASPEQIDAALRAVAAGLSVTLPEESGRRFETFPDVDERILLTPREIEVLTAVSNGLTNKEIALHLGISRHTVKFHLESLMRKLDASSRAEAVSKSFRLGWQKPYRL